MNFAGRCTPFVQGDGFAIQYRDRHYRIRESDARRLLRGTREADIYSLSGCTRLGTLTAGKEFYRLKLDWQPAFIPANRFNLLVVGIYYYAPVYHWCREGAKI